MFQGKSGAVLNVQRSCRRREGPVLSVSDLSIRFHGRGRDLLAVRGVNLDVSKGEIVALVGESGSGKSVTAMAALRLLPSSASVTGSIRVCGLEVEKLSGEELRRLRGGDVGVVFQEPMTAMNPVFTVGWQVAEAVRMHSSGVSKKEAWERAGDLLKLAGIPDAGRRLHQYPYELSGGLCQRVMIAMAISCDPPLLIADEATTALDVTVQAEILDLLRELRDRLGVAMLVITHNMGVVADIADRVAVMHRGVIVEAAETRQLFEEPTTAYTTQLLASVPKLVPHQRGDRILKSSRTLADAEAVRPGGQRGGEEFDGSPMAEALRLDELVVEFIGRRGRPVRAVDKVTLHIAPGEVVGLVGESGSGKSTVGRAALGLISPTSGGVHLLGQDVKAASRKTLKRIRRRCGIVFQDAASSLDPRMTVGDSIAEPLVIGRFEGPKGRRARVQQLLEDVQLDPVLGSRFPHELSGGQRQRVSIARALALDPLLLIADEPTSALDVSVQATVLDLLLDLQERFQFACLFITHDLAVVSLVAQRILVMHEGRVVEEGVCAQVLFQPAEEYTRRLVAAAPLPNPVQQRTRRGRRLTSQASGQSSSEF